MSGKTDPDALLESFITHNGPRCKASGLTGVAKAVWERALERKDIPQSAVLRALQSLDADISRTTIERHWAGQCRTCRKT